MNYELQITNSRKLSMDTKVNSHDKPGLTFNPCLHNHESSSNTDIINRKDHTCKFRVGTCMRRPDNAICHGLRSCQQV